MPNTALLHRTTQILRFHFACVLGRRRIGGENYATQNCVVTGKNSSEAGDVPALAEITTNH